MDRNYKPGSCKTTVYPYSNTMDRVLKGRGATINPAGRFAGSVTEEVDDGWERAEMPDSIATEVRPELARSIIARNDSPDIPFEQSINPYRGCEHGCVYCYARPSHAYVDLSPGIDFETKIFYKADAARLLRAELARPGYRCQPIMLGANTDPYQPVEKRLGVTRQILEVLLELRHPVTVITKGALVLRDLELLTALAALNLVRVTVSLTTLDPELKRTLEPRTASPQARLRVIAELARARVPVGVLTAPMIPAVNDHELEALLEAAAAAGATSAGYVLLRLPHEVKDLFRAWLEQHLPLRAAHVMSLVQQARGGRDNDPRFGLRMRGAGPWADMLRARFERARARLGLDGGRRPELDTAGFRPPRRGGQLELNW
jgi:DNA repair photolyase